ncbi:MAG: hypothetical protein NDJ90_03970 [Oligoflexia bacterium]|nr:hypothetical protein [Oligoflexia bacterium]
MTLYRVLLTLSLLTVSLAASGAEVISTGSPYGRLYREIATDLAHDVEEMGAGKTEAARLKAFEAEWRKFLLNPAAPDPTRDPASPAHGAWPPKPVVAASVAPTRIRQVSIAPVTSGAPHSLVEPRKYVEQRFGPSLAKALSEGKARLEIYGGTTRSLLADPARKGQQLVRIPSLYESWGIEKFLDVAPGQADGKPRVIIRVPPIEEYVYHYGSMGRLLGADVERVAINEADRAGLRDTMRRSVRELYARLPAKPDYVALGYASQWEKALQADGARWKLQSASELIRDEGGAWGKVLTLSNARDPKRTVRVLTLGHDKTLWGEAARFLTEGVLEQEPKGIFFTGSAGGISEGLCVYDVSIPCKFATPNRLVPIENRLEKLKSAAADPSRLRFTPLHVASRTPAEQTNAYIGRLLSGRVGTIDVEQSLIADAVAEHNRVTGRDVTFGAANVVTDKPSAAVLGGAATHDLTRVDLAKKGQAQLTAVESILESLDDAEDWAAVADAKRKAAIHSALPSVSLERIRLQNGQGKVDADPKNKLSYYLFTADPSSPSSRTLAIPMATSRFDAENYQTDEWWDAHKLEIEKARREGTPVPRQDREEVRRWLRQNGLSVNPDVVSVDPRTGAATKKELREFLLDEFLERFTEGDSVVLYRGAEKAGELDAWKSGTIPRGVRYWTPDANYAWRYARKSETFLEELVEDRAPLLKFKVPRQEFIDGVQRGHIVLGTELTKNAHQSFEKSGKFQDHLANGADYLGEGKYGLEIEVRPRRPSRMQFNRYFVGAISVDELAQARARQIESGTARLLRQEPARAAELEALKASRFAMVEAERKLLSLIRTRANAEEIEAAIRALPDGTAEIANVDWADLSSLARKRAGEGITRGPAMAPGLSAPDCVEGYRTLR